MSLPLVCRCFNQLQSFINASQGWLDFVPIRFVMFEEVGLAIDSSDRAVWRLAQKNQMILLTANRSMKDEDSLEQAIAKKTLKTLYPL